MCPRCEAAKSSQDGKKSTHKTTEKKSDQSAKNIDYSRGSQYLFLFSVLLKSTTCLVLTTTKCTTYDFEYYFVLRICKIKIRTVKISLR